MKGLREKIRGLPDDAVVVVNPRLSDDLDITCPDQMTEGWLLNLKWKSDGTLLVADLKAMVRKYDAAVAALEHYADEGEWSCRCQTGDAHLGQKCSWSLYVGMHGYDIARKALEAE